MGDNTERETLRRNQNFSDRDHPHSDVNPPVGHNAPPNNFFANINVTFLKFLFCILMIFLFLIFEEFSLNSDPAILYEDTHEKGILLSHKRFVKSGEANFFLLFEPADVEIILKPTRHDLDLYVVANEDFDYFKKKSPKLRELLEITKPTREGISIVILQHSLPWDVISPPQSPIALENAETLYWSELPPFSFSSASLGVEKIHVPSEREFVRPLLVCIFASPTGVGSYISNYTIEIRNENLHVSSYTTVRFAVERGTLSYSEMVQKFSTINTDSEDVMTSRDSSDRPSYRKGKNSPDESNEDDDDDDGVTNPILIIAKALRPIIFGILEAFFSVIL